MRARAARFKPCPPIPACGKRGELPRPSVSQLHHGGRLGQESATMPPDPVNRIAAITLDEATVIARSEDIEKEREVALRDLVEANNFLPVRAAGNGHAGPWHVHLEVIDGMLAWHIRDVAGVAAGTIGLGMARMRRSIRDYFAICDSYYKALRRASAQEIETIDMARRAIHDRGTRHLLDALDGKVETDFETARRLFTLICVLHIKA
jgi:uncharacterized protein (UPF0262 family)